MGQGAMEPLWNALPSLAMPVLVVCGARDDLYAPIAERMASLIPGARLLRIDGAGHDVPGDRPAELRAALDMFWNSHSPA
jgi:2-succinyl-6-hydroxy-2,4-cyclohexadiene-1-carboxylate synthase